MLNRERSPFLRDIGIVHMGIPAIALTHRRNLPLRDFTLRHDGYDMRFRNPGPTSARQLSRPQRGEHHKVKRPDVRRPVNHKDP
jgi:hypothetical protein